MVLNLLIGPIAALLDKVIPDKDQKNRIAHDIATLASRQAHELAKLQVETNREEAKSTSLFIAGWRPAVAWVCVISFALNYLVNPLANWALIIMEETMVLPTLDSEALFPLLFGMLGLGGLRSAEKFKGVARESHK